MAMTGGGTIRTVNAESRSRSTSNGGNQINRTGAAVVSYPAADDRTAALVTKLRMRGGMNISHSKQTTSERMKNVYESSSSPAVRAAGGTPTRQRMPVTDEKYSPYSNINMAARNEMRLRESERDMRRMERPEVVSVSQQRGAAQQRSAAQHPAARASAPSADRRVSRPQSASPAKKSGAVTSARKPESGVRSARKKIPAMESGPREVAFKRVPLPKLSLLLILMAVVFFFMINSILQNYQYKRELADIQDEYDELASYAAELELSLEDRYDMNYIEEAATELGMVKSSQVEEKYISLDLSDFVEIYSSDDDVSDGSATTLLSALAKQLSKFLND
ncbi:MAG: septum formation initiator family protein [Clostridia bacterium]|nr:septum formation initiator family protein [Clostridia bacterium]